MAAPSGRLQPHLCRTYWPVRGRTDRDKAPIVGHGVPAAHPGPARWPLVVRHAPGGTPCHAAGVTLRYRLLPEPVLVVVNIAGRELPWTALGWRGQRVYLSWVAGGGLQHLGWKDAGQVARRGPSG